MSAGILAFYSLTFFISLWLGFYLLTRDIRKRALLLTGFGLIFYAAAIFYEVIRYATPQPFSRVFSDMPVFFIYLPALMWTGGLITLIPESFQQKYRVSQIWQWLVFPLTFLAVIVHERVNLSDIFLTVIVVLPLAVVYLLLLLTLRKREEKYPLGLPLLATFFFALAIGLILPFSWLPRSWIVLSIGIDLVCLGIGIAIFDAFEEGHRLAEDMLRSFITALLIALVFSIQIALVIALDTQLTFGMVILLFSVLSTSVAISTLSNPFILLLNKAKLFDNEGTEEDGSQLRAAAGALRRVNPKVDFSLIKDEEFHRLTRKAISYLGDLPSLVSNPLTYLPLVTHRLADRNARRDSLERAHELKALLTESIQRLKPPGDELFGTSDAWRYYNALYFPYVVGLKPSRRYHHTANLAEHERQALEWFRTQVPQRTLYNWQATAAKLVTQDLQDRLARLNS